MKSSTMNTVIGSALAAAAGIFVFKAYQDKKNPSVKEDSDMRNSEEVDHRESVDADVDPAEKGLTQLDSAYRDEWQANGFPQTHKEMKELEEQ
ncbi:hypothetical protein [Planomicrobium sp. YIM 101495]|uniref:hypothetical protein n=1 Tax=Planomicrobium sp. YIM 101495 TaxID=2665160 RepID=UPI0012B9AB78|nr:hypothetical protein [Planomicrobium sp. YIM 101495]MTD31465.1 hypothetical protein [Planomicrobium sp. YIM 101495]